MSKNNIFTASITALLKVFLSAKETGEKLPVFPKKVLIVRQHNQFGDMLATVPLFRAIKEKYPETEITLIVSPQNFYAITTNEFIDEYFVFNKKKLFSRSYRLELRKLLNREYDIVVCPATVSLSSTSCILSRLANSSFRIGPKILNGKVNKFAFMFNKRVTLDWKKYPDAHVSDFGLDIVRPCGLTTKNFRASIPYSEEYEIMADEFVGYLKGKENDHKIVGLHVGAGKPPNRWSAIKFVEVIKNLNESGKYKFYLTGTDSDKAELDYVTEHSDVNLELFVNKPVPALAALIDKSDLFITNDTGVMHVAGATTTPQISIFGPTNPFNWAPLGANKYFLRKTDLIEDITVSDVLNLAEMILNKTENDAA